MLREMTKALGRFRVGELHDYPKHVWAKIAFDAKQPLDNFSKAAAHNPALQSPLKGRLHMPGRLGSQPRQ